VRPLARGGMADIYLARKAGLGGFERLVALKLLSSDDAESRAMFLDEARLVGMLHHQNIAGVIEVGVADGAHFLAMEYVHGSDLRQVLQAAAQRRIGVPFEASLSIVAAAAAGLDHAHRRCGPDGRPLRLVHRDVSLSNLMIGLDGCVKVVDFGIASTTIASVQTTPGTVRGKASYMAPEQCLGEAVDQRTDVFALGVVLYEVTTGVRCFGGPSDFDRMLAVVKGEYRSPSAIVPGYPPELEGIVRRALSLEPAHRFPSAAALVDAIESCARGYGWALGNAPIRRVMEALFDDVAATRDADVTDRVEVLTPRRLARGTVAPEPAWLEHDEEARTRGRAPIRRPPS
jgi:serine/threonine protein kinase